jgi:hypothetical protein
MYPITALKVISNPVFLQVILKSELKVIDIIRNS